LIDSCEGRKNAFSVKGHNSSQRMAQKKNFIAPEMRKHLEKAATPYLC
jgi:hypothetical protein